MQTYCWKRRRGQKARSSSVGEERQVQETRPKEIHSLAQSPVPDTSPPEEREPQQRPLTKENRPRGQQILRRKRRQHPQLPRQVLAFSADRKRKKSSAGNCWSFKQITLQITKKNNPKQNNPRQPTLVGSCKSGSAVCTRIAGFRGNSLVHQGLG